MKNLLFLILIINPFLSFADDSYVLVRAGTFEMGSPDTELDRYDDETPHSVTLTHDFLIGIYEVTQKDYEALMGDNPSLIVNPHKPVNNVNWYEAVEYCNALSLNEGLTPAYSGNEKDIRCDFEANGYRLPTEAEWEYAARGGHLNQEYHIYSGSNDIVEVAWCFDSQGYEDIDLRLGGLKAANELSVYDMSGNVVEWCWDWYNADFYIEGPEEDPIGFSLGTHRTIRGGGWECFEDVCRNAFRNGHLPTESSAQYGFRVVRTVNSD